MAERWMRKRPETKRSGLGGRWQGCSIKSKLPSYISDKQGIVPNVAWDIPMLKSVYLKFRFNQASCIFLWLTCQPYAEKISVGACGQQSDLCSSQQLAEPYWSRRSSDNHRYHHSEWSFWDFLFFPGSTLSLSGPTNWPYRWTFRTRLNLI